MGSQNHQQKPDNEHQQTKTPHQYLSSQPPRSNHRQPYQVQSLQPTARPLQTFHQTHQSPQGHQGHHSYQDHPTQDPALQTSRNGLREAERRTLTYRPQPPRTSPASPRSHNRSSTANSRIHKAMSLEQLLNPAIEHTCHSPSSSSSSSSFSSSRGLSQQCQNRIKKSSNKQASATSPKGTKGSAGARPAYTTEEGLYIWYLRTDLGMSWDQVEMYFGGQFGRHKREKGGLQCKFYRVIEGWSVERVRTQHRSLLVDDNSPEAWTAAFGVTDRTDLLFPWMRQEHQGRPLQTGALARLKAPYPENPRHKDKPPRTQRKSAGDKKKGSRL